MTNAEFNQNVYKVKKNVQNPGTENWVNMGPCKLSCICCVTQQDNHNIN